MLQVDLRQSLYFIMFSTCFENYYQPHCTYCVSIKSFHNHNHSHMGELSQNENKNSVIVSMITERQQGIQKMYFYSKDLNSLTNM